jgi:hypothetical protein
MHSIQKVEAYLYFKRRQRVIDSFKQNRVTSEVKASNIRKQASFYLCRTQKFYPLLQSFNALKKYRERKAEKIAGHTEKVHLHRMKHFFSIIQANMQSQVEEQLQKSARYYHSNTLRKIIKSM